MTSCVPLVPGFIPFNIPICNNGSPEGLIQMFNTLIATAISKTITNCFQNQTAEQLTRIRCNPKLPNSDSVYEENVACSQCIDSVLQGNLYQNQIQRKLWQTSPATVRMPINTMYETILEQMEVCGLTYCKACALSNITQVNMVQADAECISISMTSTNINLNLSSSISQMFLSNKDVLSATVQTLGVKDMQQATQIITSSILTVVNDSFLSDLRQTISQSQVIELISETSVRLNNISQASCSTITQKFVSDNEVITKAISESVLQSISTQIDSQNTLDSLGGIFSSSTTTFLSALSNAAGKIMFACVVLLGVIVLGIIAYFIYKNVKNLVDRKASQDAKNKQSHF